MATLVAERTTIDLQAEQGDDAGVLLPAAARGDARAWEALLGRYSRLVWYVIGGFRLSAADAADVSQTAWLRVAEHLGKIRDPRAFPGWLVTTTRRECLQVCRRNARQIPLAEPQLGCVLDAAPGLGPAGRPDLEVLRAEQGAELRAAVSLLPGRSQVLLRLLFADPPASYEEIAASTGMKLGSIGPSRQRCLARLRRSLGASTEEEIGACSDESGRGAS